MKKIKKQMNTEIYDNTMGPTKYYKCYLYVNNILDNVNHSPILFRKEENEHFTIPINNDTNR